MRRSGLGHGDAAARQTGRITMLRSGAAATFFGLSAVALIALPAQAAPPSDRGVAKVAEAATVRPAAVTESEEDANCSRIRRRLWVEGEGWIVRRVTTCR